MPTVADKTVDPNTVAVANTTLQTSSAVVKILDEPTIKTTRTMYYTIHKTWPAEYEDVTREQLTALWTMVTVLRSAFADFAVWVAFWTRMIKRKRFTGTILNTLGEIVSVEMLGPRNDDACESS